MAIITCTVISGNGACYTIPSIVNNTGETFTIYATPIAPDTLVDLYMIESHGYYVAISVTEVQTISYDSSWGDLEIYAEFSGSPPPPPPPQPNIPIWLICKAAQKWREL